MHSHHKNLLIELPNTKFQNIIGFFLNIDVNIITEQPNKQNSDLNINNEGSRIWKYIWI